MKRLSPFYAFAGFEILRYFTLAWIMGELFSSFPPQVLRFMAAPNLMFGAAFFFLALDPVRYGGYRPLILTGKAATVFAAVLAVYPLAGMVGERSWLGPSVVAGLGLVVVWDIIAFLVLLFRKFPHAGLADNPGSVAEPEVVEVD